MQPYVLQCRNASANILPIYPLPINSKDKTPRKSPSNKLNSGHESRAKLSIALNLLENIDLVGEMVTYIIATHQPMKICH